MLFLLLSNLTSGCWSNHEALLSLETTKTPHNTPWEAQPLLKMLFYFLQYILSSVLEWPGHSVIGMASMWDAQHFSERPGLSVRGPSSLKDSQPIWERPGLFVGGLASLWEALPLCERHCLSVISPTSMGEALPLCKKPCLCVRSHTSLWEALPLFESSVVKCSDRVHW